MSKTHDGDKVNPQPFDNSRSHFATGFGAKRRRSRGAIPYKLGVENQRDYIFWALDEGVLELMIRVRKQVTTQGKPNALFDGATYPLKPSFIRDIWVLPGFIQEFSRRDCAFALELYLDTLAYPLEEEEVQRILSAFKELLNVNLTVILDLNIHARESSLNQPLQSTNWRGRILDRIKRTFRGTSSITAWEIVPRSDSPRLQSLDMLSPMLFGASFRPLTLELLNNALLTNLSISDCGLSTSDWSQLLSSLTLDRLTTLSLRFTTVAFSDLLKLLGRHPLIQHLFISGAKSSHFDSVLELPVPAQPYLTRLQWVAAGPHHLLYFLNHINSFSQLRHIMLEEADTASCCNSTLEPYDSSTVFNKLSEIRIGSRYLELTLISLRDSGLFPWFLGCNDVDLGNRRNIMCVQVINMYRDAWLLSDEVIMNRLRALPRLGNPVNFCHDNAPLEPGESAPFVFETLFKIFPNFTKVNFLQPGFGGGHCPSIYAERLSSCAPEARRSTAEGFGSAFPRHSSGEHNQALPTAAYPDLEVHLVQLSFSDV